MTTNTNRLRTLLDAFARGDLQAAADCFAEDGRYIEAHREPLHGRAAIAAHFAQFSASARSWRFEVELVIAEGPDACVAYRFSADRGAPAVMREHVGCAVVRLLDDGAVASWREYEG